MFCMYRQLVSLEDAAAMIILVSHNNSVMGIINPSRRDGSIPSFSATTFHISFHRSVARRIVSPATLVRPVFRTVVAVESSPGRNGDCQK